MNKDMCLRESMFTFPVYDLLKVKVKHDELEVSYEEETRYHNLHRNTVENLEH